MPDEAEALEAGALEAEAPEAEAFEARAFEAEVLEDEVLVDEDEPMVPAGATPAEEGDEIEPEGAFQAPTSEEMTKENRAWMGKRLTTRGIRAGAQLPAPERQGRPPPHPPGLEVLSVEFLGSWFAS